MKKTTSTTTSKEAVRQTTKSTLSKYGSADLIKKLEAGDKLLGLSKEVALEILTQRLEKNAEKEIAIGNTEAKLKSFSGGTWVKTGSAGKTHSTGNEKPIVVKGEKPVKSENAEKPAKTVSEKVVKPVEGAIDIKFPSVKKIIDDKEMTKTDKIRGLLGLGYSVKQVAACLGTIYQFVYGVKSKMAK